MAFKRLLAAAGVALALVNPSMADTNLSQLQISVARILPQYGYGNVDVTRLNTAQLAQIRHVAASNKGQAAIRGGIGAVINNRIVRFFKR